MVARDARGLLALHAGVLEVRPRRRLHLYEHLAPVGFRHESEPAELHLQHDRAHEGTDGEPGHDPAMVERPADHARVPLCLPVEPLVEPVKQAGHRIPALVRFHLRVSPVRREHRVERKRHEERHEHRAGDRERERLEPLSRHVAHEGDRYEHGNDRKRRRRHRHADLIRAFVRGPEMVFPHFDMPHDILAHHDRVVDQDADGQRQPEQRHRVEREAERMHRNEAREYRYRQREPGDHRGPPRIQEEEHDKHGEQGALDQRLLDIRHRTFHAVA